MKTLIFSLLPIFWAPTCLAELTAKVAGLQIVSHSYEPEGDSFNNELRPFNWPKGTAISILIKTSGKNIVGMGDNRESITTFSDGKGTDFLKAKSRFSRGPYSFEGTKVSKDGKALITQIETDAVPVTGAEKIEMKGALKVKVASKSKLSKSTKSKLVKGSEFKIGDLVFTINEAEKPQFGDAEWSIALSLPLAKEDYKEIVFYGADGDEIKAIQAGSSTMTSGGKVSRTVNYEFEKKPDSVVLGLDRWTDMETVEVPLDLAIPVGL